MQCKALSPRALEGSTLVTTWATNRSTPPTALACLLGTPAAPVAMCRRPCPCPPHTSTHQPPPQAMLSIGAAMMGAAHVVGVDVDDDALRIARRNAEQYGEPLPVRGVGGGVRAQGVWSEGGACRVGLQGTRVCVCRPLIDTLLVLRCTVLRCRSTLCGATSPR